LFQLKTERGLRHKWLCGAFFLAHFLLVVAVSCHDTVWLVAHDLTLLPSPFVRLARNIEPVSSASLGQNLARANPLRRSLVTYYDLAGIDRGYGYFAPNVPANYKLLFELSYPENRTQYALPVIGSKSAGLRMASLLDEIGRAKSDALREYLIRGIARSVWREHPDAVAVRAIFGLARMPTISEFEKGKRESYEFLYAYDFSLHNASPDSTIP
jgi:hypothetical protein